MVAPENPKTKILGKCFTVKWFTFAELEKNANTLFYRELPIAANPNATAALCYVDSAAYFRRNNTFQCVKSDGRIVDLTDLNFPQLRNMRLLAKCANRRIPNSTSNFQKWPKWLLYLFLCLLSGIELRSRVPRPRLPSNLLQLIANCPSLS